MSGWKPRVWLIVWCVIGVVLRVFVMLAAPDQLSQDRDLYLGIAQELRIGHGYATPGSEPPRPTAFRPPLYPLLLATTGDNPGLIGGMHLLLAAGMIAAVGLASYQMARGHRLWFLGPAIVSVDPLLLLYCRQPMTETLCACLSAVLIWRVTRAEQATSPWKTTCGEGVVWGLCLLARPTYGAVLAIWLAVEVLRSFQQPRDADLSKQPGLWRPYLRIRRIAVVIAVAMLTVCPWAIRNLWVFGRPIVTTTHGGYTLWLANNPDYYRDVVEGGVSNWDGLKLSRWQIANDQLLDQQGITGEASRDRALSRMAVEFIRRNPVRFIQAALLRAGRFWGIGPSQTEGNGQNLPIVWGVGGYYLTLWVGGIVLLLMCFRMRGFPVTPGVSTAMVLVLGFFLVHLVYWTDVRMRAPIMPAVAVIMASAWGLKNHSRGPDS